MLSSGGGTGDLGEDVPASVWTIAVDRAGCWLDGDQDLLEVLEVSREDVRGRLLEDIAPELAMLRAQLAEALLSRRPIRGIDVPLSGPGAKLSHRLLRASVHPLPYGGTAAATIVLVDVSKEEQIASSLSRYRLMQRATLDAIWEWNIVTGKSWWSSRNYELLGYDRTTDPSFEAWARMLHDEDRPRVLEKFPALFASNASTWQDEYRYHRFDGRIGIIDDRGYLERDENGAPLRMIGVMRDVTEERAAEHALRESEERFRQIAETIQEVFWMCDLTTGQPMYVSPAFERISGHAPETITGPFGFLEIIHPDDRKRVAEQLAVLVVGDPFDEIYRVVRPDGSIAWVHDRATPIEDATGRPTRAVGITVDITEQRQLEEQLLLSQKLESIGRLAGGVAHDFNNLLTVVLGCTTFAIDRLPADSPLRSDLASVVDAAERATKLTSQLLTFARRRVISPTTVNLAELTHGIERLLRRAIGESIELEIHLDPTLGFIRADPGQIEQVLTNLTLNARDAMPNGGKLTIAARNTTIDANAAARGIELVPGEYVTLTVSDTGVGISPETRRHVFEPFFTTKDPGQGTGLGLATCYGIVRQAAGHISVESEPGYGTRFEILLPRIYEVPHSVEARAPISSNGGGETVLFVEDDHALRQVGTRMLSQHGYRVLSAGSGTEALSLVADHRGSIDLLVTDVVMPGMSGAELAARLLTARPDLRVLYTSGYAESVVVQHGVPHPGISLLVKPYVEATLLEKVRATIDASATAR